MSSKEIMQVKDIPLDRLLDEVTRIHYEDFRLMQICATKVAENRYEILYTFGKGYEWKHVRVTVSHEEKVPSITSIFETAYLYENEIHDLFGIQIEMMNYDFKGKLFRTGVQFPFA
ncbi:MAG: NADH-quinone oxidoreductase subunit C [Lachnospiraceae bacterium]|jgi:ech hydrogenase subunit D|nr:NADH-quinone oxidoreductase subunit C [Lachnospiraceae bacterium]